MTPDGVADALGCRASYRAMHRNNLAARAKDTTAWLEKSAAEPDFFIIVYKPVRGGHPCTWCRCKRDRGQHRDCGNPCGQPAVRGIELYFAGTTFKDPTRVCLYHLPAFRRWAENSAAGQFAP